MGSASSSILTVEEAASRCTAEELRLFEVGFRRLSSVQGEDAKPRSRFIASRRTAARTAITSSGESSTLVSSSTNGSAQRERSSTIGSYFFGWLHPLERICGVDMDALEDSDFDDDDDDDEEVQR